MKKFGSGNIQYRIPQGRILPLGPWSVVKVATQTVRIDFLGQGDQALCRHRGMRYTEFIAITSIPQNSKSHNFTTGFESKGRKQVPTSLDEDSSSEKGAVFASVCIRGIRFRIARAKGAGYILGGCRGHLQNFLDNWGSQHKFFHNVLKVVSQILNGLQGSDSSSKH